MEPTAAPAAHEGRYAALRGEVAGLTTEELLDVIEAAQRDKDAASARQALALAHLSAREPHLRRTAPRSRSTTGWATSGWTHPSSPHPGWGCRSMSRRGE